MSAARSPTAEIDAAIARGEWWLSLFCELFDLGMTRAEALCVPTEGPLRKFAQVADRVFRAVRLAAVGYLRLGQILSGLADLRGRSAADIADARARARAKADADAAARARAGDRTSALLDPGEAETLERDHEDDVEARDTETGSDPRDRDPLVEALDKRLVAVDPAIVDFDDLQLRETVLRICADLGVTPDWARWEAGHWATPEAPPASAQAVQIPVPIPVPTPKPDHPAAKVVRPPVLPGLPGSVPRAPEMTPARRFLAERDAERGRPRLE